MTVETAKMEIVAHAASALDSPQYEPFGPAFPVEEFNARLDMTRDGLASRGLDAGLFFAADTRFYLSGYEYPASAAYHLLVVPIGFKPFIVTRKHFEMGVRASTWIDDCITFPDSGDPIETTRQALVARKLGSARLGLEQAALTLTVQTAKALELALPRAEFADCSGIVEALRIVKSHREIAYMRRAAAISDAGIEAARAMIKPGVSERDVAAEITRVMTLAGGDYQAIPVLVGIAERARVATPLWTSRKLAPGEMMWVEVFGTVRRYTAGLKASFGAHPVSPDAMRRMETVMLAYRRAVAEIREGVPASVVPESIQATFREAGYSETAYHQSGYSVGVSFMPNPHEAWMFSLRRGNAAPLKAGMTLFPIANLYGPGATVSASGTVLVTQSGCNQLTRFQPSVEDLGH